MVTRRAVLKGTAAASIGAIAAAHGAAPVEASALNCGFGQLAGGAAAGFSKFRDAFQVALKFHKVSADIFLKEAVSGGVAVFFKFFDKHWTAEETLQLGSEFFKDLQTSELYFSKIEVGKAEFFVKDLKTNAAVRGTFDINKEGVSYNFEQQAPNTDGQIG
jgi:hypothetical protein